MAKGKGRSACTLLFDHRKGALTDAERRKAIELRRMRMSWAGVSRAVGRSIPDLQAALAAPKD